MTVYLLSFPVGEYLPSRAGPRPTAAARIADQLRVSRATVGEMLQRLESDGLIVRGEKKEALLTDTGKTMAEKVVRRHRVVERLLTDVMGYSAPEAHEKADNIDDGFDDEMLERLFERLGRPDRCPHGYPIDPAVEQAENSLLRPLDEISVGGSAEVVRVAEHDTELLRSFYEIGLAPGTRLQVVAADGTTESAVTVLRAGTELTLASEQAQGVFVREL